MIWDRGGALPIPLEIWMDEFYAGARPADTEQLMGVIRSRNISMIPILQSVAQIKALFSAEKWEIIMDNCPIMIYLGAGAGALDTHKYISELLGKATIDTIGDGKHGSSYNSSFNKAGRELMTPQEVKRMDRKKCIIFMEGERPIIDRKALPWEDKGATNTEIRKARNLQKKHPELNIQIPDKTPAFKQAIEEVLDKAKTELAAKKRELQLKSEVIDVTLPSKRDELGHKHPNTLALEEIQKIFIGMGYEVVDGPEVEYDYYNFEALNIPANHPAKDEQDTFYINDKIVLRTQTSPVQARVMEKGKLPIRMISPGRVYRADEVDATHSPCFHQVEGLVIDKGITFADLKGTLAEFAKELFGPDTKVKFRPHHFPFTEPSAEMDVSCFKCGGKGCRLSRRWSEVPLKSSQS